MDKPIGADAGVRKGEPVTRESAPLAATLNASIVLLNWLLTNKWRSSGLSKTTLELIPGPVNGEPASCDKTPPEPMLKTLTTALEPLESPTYRRVLAQLQSIPAAFTPAPPIGNGDPTTATTTPS